eukprot:15338570-Ditylum_brightwellii.AAC.1
MAYAGVYSMYTVVYTSVGQGESRKPLGLRTMPKDWPILISFWRYQCMSARRRMTEVSSIKEIASASPGSLLYFQQKFLFAQWNIEFNQYNT